MTFEVTVAGTVDAFDQAAFTTNLAASVGAPASHISLAVTSAAGVQVDATITTEDEAVVAKARELAGDATALAAAVGVAVESVAPARESIMALGKTPRPCALQWRRPGIHLSG